MNLIATKTGRERAVLLQPGLASSAEIIAWLESVVDVRPLPEQGVRFEQEMFEQALRENSRLNPGFKIPAQLSFRSFEVLKTDASLRHIGCEGFSFCDTINRPMVIVEMNSGYAHSSISKLQLELNIVRGIDESDCRDSPQALRSFLGFIDLFEDGYYEGSCCLRAPEGPTPSHENH